jgi:hypothetical protein
MLLFKDFKSLSSLLKGRTFVTSQVRQISQGRLLGPQRRLRLDVGFNSKRNLSKKVKSKFRGTNSSMTMRVVSRNKVRILKGVLLEKGRMNDNHMCGVHHSKFGVIFCSDVAGARVLALAALAYFCILGVTLGISNIVSVLLIIELLS